MLGTSLRVLGDPTGFGTPALPAGFGTPVLPVPRFGALGNPAGFGAPVLPVPRFWALGNPIVEKPPAQDKWTQGHACRRIL